MKPGDLVVVGNYGSCIPLMDKTLSEPPLRNVTCHLNRGELGLIVKRNGGDVLLLTPEGMGWAWHGNFIRVKP